MSKRARRVIAGHLHRLADRINPPRIVEFEIPDRTPERQAKALESLVKEQRQANRIAQREALRTEFDRDRLMLRMDVGQSGDAMQEGVKVRIESDGTGVGTRVMVDDKPVTNAVRATWTATADGVARAVIECDAVPATIEGITST